MGSEVGYADERPVHTVTLSPFWIDQTEVTNGMNALCVQAKVCNPPSDFVFDPTFPIHSMEKAVLA